MSRFGKRSIGLAMAGCLLAGCGGALPPPPLSSTGSARVGPHGGMALALPDEAGFAEFRNEPEPEGRGAVSTSLVVYFVEKDAKTPMATLPSDVMFKVDLPNAGRTFTLKAEPKADDPAGSARFVSESGANRLADLRGELSAKVGGKPVKVPFDGVR